MIEMINRKINECCRANRRNVQKRTKPEEQLKNMLSQAESIIKLSPVKTGRNHPIFSFVASISRKVFYNDLFELNATLKGSADYSSYKEDLGWLNNTYLDEYTMLNKIIISLTQDAVWSFPWESTRFTNCLSHIGSNVKEPFIFQPNNHFSHLFLPLGLTIIFNGNHSAACGIIKGEGSIEVKNIVDISRNCVDYYFDGTYIRRKMDNSKIYKVKQFECGVLFELSRLIYANDIDFLAGMNVERKVNIHKPKDTEWRIFNRNDCQILHYCFDDEGECEVAVNDYTIIFTTTSESFGMSTTNAAESLATFVAQQLGIPLEKVICYEHYIEDELINRIQFEVKNGVLADPIFYSDVLPISLENI